MSVIRSCRDQPSRYSLGFLGSLQSRRRKHPLRLSACFRESSTGSDIQPAHLNTQFPLALATDGTDDTAGRAERHTRSERTRLTPVSLRCTRRSVSKRHVTARSLSIADWILQISRRIYSFVNITLPRVPYLCGREKTRQLIEIFLS